MSWASVVRRSLPAVSHLNSNSSEWNPPRAPFHAFCKDCGAEAELCTKGCDRPPISTWRGKRLCGGCLYDAMWRLGSESMSIGVIQGADKKNDPPFKCCGCSSAPAPASVEAPKTKAIIMKGSVV